MMGRSPVCERWTPRFEPLEPRLLLSAAEETGLPFIGPVEGPLMGMGASSLEPSRATAPTYDVGDHYWYFDQRVPLLRVCGGVAIGFAEGADTQQVLDALLSQEGPLAGYEAVRPLGNIGVQLKAATAARKPEGGTRPGEPRPRPSLRIRM